MFSSSRRSPLYYFISLNLEVGHSGETEREEVEIPLTKVKVLEGHTKEVVLRVIAHW